MRLLLVIAVLFVSCSKTESPVSPPPPPPPKMSGIWDATLTGTSPYSATINITETNGNLTATLAISGIGSLVFTGTVSESYLVTLNGTEPGYRYLITGTTNEEKTSLSGKMDMWDTDPQPETYEGFFNLTATKR